MGWLKFLKNIGNAEGTRESVRLSYKKHFDGAPAAGHDTDCHSVGLYGVLATRYRLLGMPVAEVELWAELAPFLDMPAERGVQALSEYVVYREFPNEARTLWLKAEINRALRLRGPHLQFAALAMANQVLWTHWLDVDTKKLINGVSAEMDRTLRRASLQAESAKVPLWRQGKEISEGPRQLRPEPALKYNLDKLRDGISPQEAIDLLLGACNKPDTMFVTEQWISPRLKQLTVHLSNPITSDQAQALQDAILQRCPFKDVLGWLGSEALSWNDYLARKKMVDREAERARVKEVRKRWKNSDWEELARLRAEGVHVYVPPEIALRHNEDAEADDSRRNETDHIDGKT